MVPDLINNVKPAQVWIPLEPAPPEIRRGWNYLFAVGLLRPGVTQSEALSELRGIQAQTNKQFPDNQHDVDIQPLSKAVFGDLHTLLLMMQAAVGFILLIACVNLANMLLARAANRAREFAVRRALGASPGRMIQQALTESLLLSVAGAAAGLLFAEGLTHIPIAAWPKNFVRPSDVHLDGMVLAFTALLAVGTGVLFGLIPALRILRQDEKDALQQGRTVTESREQNRTRAALVIAEIALSMLLVAGALNMAFYFLRLLHIDPGMNPENTLAMTVSLSPAQYATPGDQSRFFDTVLDKFSGTSGGDARRRELRHSRSSLREITATLATMDSRKALQSTIHLRIFTMSRQATSLPLKLRCCRGAILHGRTGRIRRKSSSLIGVWHRDFGRDRVPSGNAFIAAAKTAITP